MNIVWTRPDNSVAITILAIPVDRRKHAAELQVRGDIPADYVAVAFDYALPTDRSRRDDWTWNGTEIVVSTGA